MKKINVLTIDDDFVNLKLIEAMLKRNAFINEVVKAQNGLEALNILSQRSAEPDSSKHINIILLDIVMPVMNGLEFLDQLQVRPEASVPVIVLTTDETAKKEAFDRGAYDFLTKPIFEKDLSKKINDAILMLDE
ncbi:MAG: response regulator [Campylobacter sp.]